MSGTKGELGLPIIDCTPGDPTCVSPGYGGGPIWIQPPPMQTVHIGNQPIHPTPPPVVTLPPVIVPPQLPAANTAVTPAATLPTTAQPASSVWEQPEPLDNTLWIAGGIAAAVIIGLSLLKG
jgi:hypothetical protein